MLHPKSSSDKPTALQEISYFLKAIWSEFKASLFTVVLCLIVFGFLFIIFREIFDLIIEFLHDFVGN